MCLNERNSESETSFSNPNVVRRVLDLTQKLEHLWDFRNRKVTVDQQALHPLHPLHPDNLKETFSIILEELQPLVLRKDGYEAFTTHTALQCVEQSRGAAPQKKSGLQLICTWFEEFASEATSTRAISRLVQLEDEAKGRKTFPLACLVEATMDKECIHARRHRTQTLMPSTRF